MADNFIACSMEAGVDRFGKAVVEGERFHLLKNAIDVDSYAGDPSACERAKRSLGFAGVPLIGHVGRFDPVKNHLFLVETFSEVKRRIPDAKLLLVGRGPFEGGVRQAVEDAGLEGDVVFFGVTDRVPDVLKALDAFVFPSFSEGLPMSVMEAQAAGVPCVLSTGVPELAVAVPFAVERLPLEAGAGRGLMRLSALCRSASTGRKLPRPCACRVSISATRPHGSNRTIWIWLKPNKKQGKVRKRCNTNRTC